MNNKASEGHLKRWMQDATRDAMAQKTHSSASEQSDRQAYQELKELEMTAREALDLLSWIDDGDWSDEQERVIKRLRLALQAMEDSE